MYYAIVELFIQFVCSFLARKMPKGLHKSLGIQFIVRSKIVRQIHWKICCALSLSKYKAHGITKIAKIAVKNSQNIIDTYSFFYVAFAGSLDAEGNLSWIGANWHVVAQNNTLTKIVVGLIVFLPAYGVLLNRLQVIGKKK